MSGNSHANRRRGVVRNRLLHPSTASQNPVQWESRASAIHARLDNEVKTGKTTLIRCTKSLAGSKVNSVRSNVRGSFTQKQHRGQDDHCTFTARSRTPFQECCLFRHNSGVL